jgi:hypothetical protein
MQCFPPHSGSALTYRAFVKQIRDGRIQAVMES